MALKFGREMRTPAIQAGLTTRRLTLREIFPPAVGASLVVGESQVRTIDVLVVVDKTRMPLAA